MKTALLAALLSLAPAWALEPEVSQEPVLKWDVEIPAPVGQPGEVPIPQPEPVEFEVLNSRTKEVFVQEPAEISGLPPVEGKIRMTVQRVADPGLTDLPPPLPALPPDNPAVLSSLAELREAYRDPDLVFLSASVHLADKGSQEARTLLRIYPNGQANQQVVAWSNVNFLHFIGQRGYRLNHEDGTVQDVGILMGAGPVYGNAMRQVAQQAGREYEAPEIPELPDLATAGPAFALVEGNSDSPAFATLEQLHDLFRKSGATLKDQYLIREQAQAERKAYLLANPPQPDDVTIRVWRRTPVPNQSPEESR
jgi:hypothetical protein